MQQKPLKFVVKDVLHGTAYKRENSFKQVGSDSGDGSEHKTSDTKLKIKK